MDQFLKLAPLALPAIAVTLGIYAFFRTKKREKIEFDDRLRILTISVCDRIIPKTNRPNPSFIYKYIKHEQQKLVSFNSKLTFEFIIQEIRNNLLDLITDFNLVYELDAYLDIVLSFEYQGGDDPSGKRIRKKRIIRSYFDVKNLRPDKDDSNQPVDILKVFILELDNPDPEKRFREKENQLIIQKENKNIMSAQMFYFEISINDSINIIKNRNNLFQFTVLDSLIDLLEYSELNDEGKDFWEISEHKKSNSPQSIPLFVNSIPDMDSIITFSYNTDNKRDELMLLYKEKEEIEIRIAKLLILLDSLILQKTEIEYLFSTKKSNEDFDRFAEERYFNLKYLAHLERSWLLHNELDYHLFYHHHIMDRTKLIYSTANAGIITASLLWYEINPSLVSGLFFIELVSNYYMLSILEKRIKEKVLHVNCNRKKSKNKDLNIAIKAKPLGYEILIQSECRVLDYVTVLQIDNDVKAKRELKSQLAKIKDYAKLEINQIHLNRKETDKVIFWKEFKRDTDKLLNDEFEYFFYGDDRDVLYQNEVTSGKKSVIDQCTHSRKSSTNSVKGFKELLNDIHYN